MTDKLNEYVDLLLKCVGLKDKKYIFISMPNFLNDFKEILEDKLKSYNLDGVYFDLFDPFKKHELLITLSLDELKKCKEFDKSIYNEYAKLDAAFLFIQSMVPNLMDDVDPDVLKEISLYARSTQKYFRDLYEAEKLNWCIAGASNKFWAGDGLNLSEDELWDLIFKVSLVTGDNTSYDKWKKKLKNMNDRANILNKYRFKYLKYKNSLGTDLTIYLPKNHIWCTGYNNKRYICNLPTEEIFTCPEFDKTEGIVYNSKPLFYNNVLIDEFYLKFSNGKVVDYDAKIGKEMLKVILENDPNSAFLGEVALVSYDSPINNTNIIFKETLYDENASCHLALGTGFLECVESHDENLRNNGVNEAKIHVDFMIGTNDLNIIGVDFKDNEVVLMENGNLVID